MFPEGLLHCVVFSLATPSVEDDHTAGLKSYTNQLIDWLLFFAQSTYGCFWDPKGKDASIGFLLRYYIIMSSQMGENRHCV